MMRPISVSYKLGLAIMVIVLAILFPLGFIINQAVTNFYISTKQTELQTFGKKLASSMATSHNVKELNGPKKFIGLTNYKAVIFNAQGHAVENIGNLNFKITNKDWKSLTKFTPVEKQWHSPSGQTYLLEAVPINQSKQLKGAILLFANMDTVLASVHDIRSTLYLAGFGAILLALGFTNFLSKRLSRPLIEMEAATQKIAEGDLEIRLETTSDDELGRLADSINKMAFSLEQIQSHRKEFFANIAHELKTPITYLSGYADVLKKGLVPSKEEEQHYLSIIQEESGRLSNLINDLFDLAILDEGKITLSFEPLEINETISQICHSMTVKAREKGVAMNVLLSDEPLWVHANSLRMEQIIYNLVTNALRYTENGHISIKTLSSENKVKIQIEDTGVGINKEDQKQIFDRFFRVDQSRSRQTGGTGLGLAIVKELVELQNGTINVKSTIGKGTQFILMFPQTKGRIGN